MTETFEIKFADWHPAEMLNHGAIPLWEKEIEKRTNGRVKFINSFGELPHKSIDYWNLVLNGTVDMTTWATSTDRDAFPLSMAFTLPFVFPSADIAMAVCWELLEKYMLNTEFKFVKPLWLTGPGLMSICTSVRQVRTLEDMKGLKIPGHGLPIKTFKALGANPVKSDPIEIMSGRAIEKGLIDTLGDSWAGPDAPVPPVGKKMIYNTVNIDMGTTGMVCIMNLKLWNSLPPDIQKVFEDKDLSGVNMSRKSVSGSDAARLTGIEIAKKGYPNVYCLPEDEKARWMKAVQPVIDEWVTEMDGRGLPGSAILADIHELVKKYSK